MLEDALEKFLELINKWNNMENRTSGKWSVLETWISKEFPSNKSHSATSNLPHFAFFSIRRYYAALILIMSFIPEDCVCQFLLVKVNWNEVFFSSDEYAMVRVLTSNCVRVLQIFVKRSVDIVKLQMSQPLEHENCQH